MKTIKLICPVCDKEFDKSIYEYNRVMKRNAPVFCSRSCCGKTHIDNIPKHLRGNIEHLKEVNRRDKFSSFKMYLGMAKRRSVGGYNERTRLGKTNLTLEYLKQIWESQSGICPFTGLEMELPESTCWTGLAINPWRASLDRIDNSIGYVEGNIRFVCQMVNVARGKYTEADFIEMCKLVTYNQ